VTELDPDDFRRLMGHWATGVSVVTALATDGPAGATANALSSLSLEPPLVLVCFDKSSRTLHAVRESERFGINILATRQEDVSRLFATKLDQNEKFDAVPFTVAHGAPILTGVLAWAVCALDAEFTHGDHIVAIGEVVGFGVDVEVEPLLFYRGRYGALAPAPL
jgi:flavin reductase (DIM6/NTAB) family NADH-FMN oxidoreductase RutF